LRPQKSHKVEESIFLPNKEDWCSMGEREGGINPVAMVFVKELMQEHKFPGTGVYETIGRRSAFIQSDFEM